LPKQQQNQQPFCQKSHITNYHHESKEKILKIIPLQKQTPTFSPFPQKVFA